MPLNFRTATSADLPFIVRLIHEDSVVPSGEDMDDPAGQPYAAALAAIDADPNQAVYIAERDGEPVGTYQLSFVPGIARRGMWRGLVEAVHVAPGHRSKGYGAEMMAHAIALCRSRGCGMVQLTSNKARVDAHRFYRRLGFAQSHEGFKLYL